MFTAMEILKYVVRARRVTSELIFGAVCVYLMMGIVGALLFAVLDLWSPGALHLPAGVGSAVGDAAQFSTVAYYSFVTLTTLGYGDITPVSRLARSALMILSTYCCKSDVRLKIIHPAVDTQPPRLRVDCSN